MIPTWAKDKIVAPHPNEMRLVWSPKGGLVCVNGIYEDFTRESLTTAQRDAIEAQSARQAAFLRATPKAQDAYTGSFGRFSHTWQEHFVRRR